MSKRPNIVYINSHDTGRMIGPMGYGVHTPNLQRLAEQGLLLRHNHCVAPTCSPARAALVTGQYAHTVGQIGLANRGIRIATPEHHIAKHLATNGYQTAWWGMPDNHTGGKEQVGYTTGLGHDEDAIAAFIEGEHDQPFFLSVSFTVTHRKGPGFAAEPDHERYDPRYLQVPASLPDTAETRADWAHFCSDATLLDAKMGAVFDALERAGLSDDTLVIATTDHGIAFPLHKCQLTCQGTGTFCILRGPGGFEGGKVVDQLTSHLDLFPTICEVAGITVPERLHGRSLVPLARGGDQPLHEELFAEVTYHAAYEPGRAVRTDRYLYIKRFGDRRVPVKPNCDRSPTKDVMLERGWAELPVPAEALYDTAMDPLERDNRIDDPGLAAVADDLRARLRAWMERTDDPLLRTDPVPLPEGAWADDQDALHPGDTPKPATASA